MARNEEKAQSMLHRYLRSKANPAPPKRRPPRATYCDDVDEAIHWLRQVVRDLRVGVSDIQNEALEEGKLRDLNDSLNRLLRERRAWERRVLALGGEVPSELVQQPQEAALRPGRGPRHHGQRGRKRGRAGEKSDGDGDCGGTDGGGGGGGIVEIDGFFYFGAARNLPGVAELAAKAKRRNAAGRGDGAGDDDGDDGDDALEELREHPKRLAARLDRSYFGLNERGTARADAIRAEIALRDALAEDWEKNGGEAVDAPWDDSFRNFIGQRPDVEKQPDIMQNLLLERKKAEALELLRAGVRPS